MNGLYQHAVVLGWEVAEMGRDAQILPWIREIKSEVWKVCKALPHSHCAHLWCKYGEQNTDLGEAAERFVRQKTQTQQPAPPPSLAPSSSMSLGG